MEFFNRIERKADDFCRDFLACGRRQTAAEVRNLQSIFVNPAVFHDQANISLVVFENRDVV